MRRVQRWTRIMRILIVDDDRDLIMLLSDILRKGGYDVISAADGSEAWGILQREKIHFVITDWMMPEMDGLELCKRIRSAAFPYYIYDSVDLIADQI